MLDFDFIEWDDANVGHIADSGLTTEEVEDVLYSPDARPFRSRSTGRPAGIEVIIRPATAYEIED
jgi:hypothetical protein